MEESRFMVGSSLPLATAATLLSRTGPDVPSVSGRFYVLRGVIIIPPPSKRLPQDVAVCRDLSYTRLRFFSARMNRIDECVSREIFVFVNHEVRYRPAHESERGARDPNLPRRRR